jgi:hypothetical protein
MFHFSIFDIGIDRNEKWPFVTMTSFQRRAAVALSMSGAVYVAFCHHVEESQRTAWESYTGLDASNYLGDSYKYFESVDAQYFKQLSIVMPPNSTADFQNFPIYEVFDNKDPAPDSGLGPYLVRICNSGRKMVLFVCFQFSRSSFYLRLCGRAPP